MREVIYAFIFLIVSTLFFYILMWVRDEVITKIEANLTIPTSSRWYTLRENLKDQLDEILYYYPFFIIAAVVLLILVAIFRRQAESKYYYYGWGSP